MVKPASEIQRTIGVVGAVAALVGFVIGGGLFALPENLAQFAGPGVVFSFVLAGLVALVFCFLAAQIGSVFPVSGASFVSISHLLSPFFGFCMSWMLLFALPVAAALLAYTFADYFVSFVPSLSKMFVALAIIAIFGGVNLLGAAAAVNTQTTMVIFLLIALVVFCAGGFARFDMNAISPFAPNGWKPIMTSAVPAFFAFVGFMVIIEIGGEIKNPAINIPIALFASFGIVLVVYCAVTIALIAIIPWGRLAATPAAIARASEIALPDYLRPIIPVAALAAIATTINGIVLTYSREVYALARAGIFPLLFSKVSTRHGEPVYGVLMITFLGLAAVAVGGEILQYATAAVAAVMIQQLCIAIAVVRLPGKMPAHFKSAQFKLPRIWRYLLSGTTVLSSVGFIFISLSESTGIRVTVVGAFVAGVLAYIMRAAWLKKRNIDVGALVLQQIPDAASIHRLKASPMQQKGSNTYD